MGVGMQKLAVQSPKELPRLDARLARVLFPKYTVIQKNIPEVTGASEVTNKSAYKSMFPHCHQIVRLLTGISPELIER